MTRSAAKDLLNLSQLECRSGCHLIGSLPLRLRDTRRLEPVGAERCSAMCGLRHSHPVHRHANSNQYRSKYFQT